MTQKTEKTVYFLGAGASAASDFKLPVMEGFFDKEHFKKGGEYPNLKQFLNTFCPNTDWPDINLEEIITHLELTMEGFSWGFIDPTLIEAKEELYKYIKIRFDEPVKDKVCKKYKELFKNLNQDNDSIITLNYDLIIDNSLYPPILDESDELLGEGYTHLSGYPPPSIQILKKVYIKLHGSLNWIYCPSFDCPNNRMFFKCEGYAQAGDPCSLCGTSLEIVIVPPTMKKSFEKFPKLGFLWHVAFNKLKEADRIIVIGMSFPDSDYYLKWVVRQAMMERQRKSGDLPELVIVNPDIENPEFINKYKDIFGISPAEKDKYNGLDAYLSAVIASEAKQSQNE